jgi:hypothetical protein
MEMEVYRGHTLGRTKDKEKSELALSMNGSLRDVMKRISVSPI